MTAKTTSPPSSSSSSSSALSFFYSSLHVIFCGLGIYLCFVLQGIVHEGLYKNNFTHRVTPSSSTSPSEPIEKNEKFTFSLFLVFFQCVGNFVLALLATGWTSWYNKYKGKGKEKSNDHVLTNGKSSPASTGPSHVDYFLISLTYLLSMWLSNVALQYISYPAQALAKCCKLIPVMIMRIFIVGKRYSVREYFQVALITIGISVFMLYEGSGKGGKHDNSIAPPSSAFGLFLCFLSLVCDGYTSPTQEKLNEKYHISMNAMQININFWAILISFIPLVFTGELFLSLEFIMRHPEVLIHLTFFSLCSSIGQSIIIHTVISFNSLVLVTITTTRKFFSILLSVIWYGHHINAIQWGGVAFLFGGLFMEVQDKWKKHKKP